MDSGIYDDFIRASRLSKPMTGLIRGVSVTDSLQSFALQGHLKKMQAHLEAGKVTYALPVENELLPVSQLLGKKLSLSWQGAIHCCHCGRKTNKSFNQGFCYPCFRSLPQCDRCIVSPETCHYFEGTCRDATWGETYCMTDHVVYLANSSGIKVGITRATQVPTRWIDQGAVQAMPLLRVATRQQSGLIETILKASVKDKTNWRTMLKGHIPPMDLPEAGKQLLEQHQDEIMVLQQQFGVQAIQPVSSPDVMALDYPVLEYPVKVASLSFDKTPDVQGILMGIKGQYLIFDCGVLNIRKHTAYQVKISVLE